MSTARSRGASKSTISHILAGSRGRAADRDFGATVGAGVRRQVRENPMKRPHRTDKLHLSTQTIREISRPALVGAAGGTATGAVCTDASLRLVCAQ
jgi:hypothetical protein